MLYSVGRIKSSHVLHFSHLLRSFLLVIFPDYNRRRSRSSTLVQHATSVRQYTLTFSRGFTDHRRSSLVFRTRLRLTCGRWAVSLWNCSLDYHYSLERVSIIRLLELWRCSGEYCHFHISTWPIWRVWRDIGYGQLWVVLMKGLHLQIAASANAGNGQTNESVL